MRSLIRKRGATSTLGHSLSAKLNIRRKPVNQLQRLIGRQTDEHLFTVSAWSRVEREQHIAGAREGRHVRMGRFIDQDDAAG